MKALRISQFALFFVLIVSTFTSAPCRAQDKPTSGSKNNDSKKDASTESTKVETAEGKVISVIDGDSIKVKTSDGKEVEVQIEGTDAPEMKQPFGKESSKALSAMVLDKDVKLSWEKEDTYNRLLAQVHVGDKHVNLEMIKEGWAWHFKRYNKSKELAAAEESAKKGKKGLWADEKPVAPWDYRKDNKAPDKPDR